MPFYGGLRSKKNLAATQLRDVAALQCDVIVKDLNMSIETSKAASGNVIEGRHQDISMFFYPIDSSTSSTSNNSRKLLEIEIIIKSGNSGCLFGSPVLAGMCFTAKKLCHLTTCMTEIFL